MSLIRVVLLVLCSASIAAAQQVPPPPLTPLRAAAAPAFWELITGYEGDTEGSGYGFFGPSYVRPIRPGLSWTARASGNYLAYRMGDAESAVRVRSPGVSSALGLQFGDTSFARVLAGPEVKWRRTITGGPAGSSSDSDLTVGANVSGEVYANPTSHNNVQGIVNYGTADAYTWARLGFKEQLNNHSWQGASTTFLGVEVIGQGNRDIRSRQVGGFFEVTRPRASASMVFKAGYKQSTFDVGPGTSGPYFSVGFYRRLN